MEHQALYRKYRPQVFGEVIGQEHVTRTLVREARERRVAHAYLFAGPRGTGKTSTAPILAKAINCEDPRHDGEPCDRCAPCQALTAGSSLAVQGFGRASGAGLAGVCGGGGCRSRGAFPGPWGPGHEMGVAPPPLARF
ncbi:MAG: hypothetical protein OXC98_00565, partial [bacterium]|nr:hypothetical protein [bacterium]